MFTPAQRRIFEYTLAEGDQRVYDPLEVRRLLLAETGGKLTRTWDAAREVAALLRAGEEVPLDALQAEQRLMDAGRVAFGLGKFAETGVPDLEVWGVLDAYSRFVGNSGGKEGSGPTSLPVSAGPPASPPTTPSASACT